MFFFNKNQFFYVLTWKIVRLLSYVNYGITGVIIGHEMGHGFDDVGIRISQYGNKTTLSKNILQNYYRRAECFLDQFEQYYGETRPPRRFTLPDDYIDMVCWYFYFSINTSLLLFLCKYRVANCHTFCFKIFVLFAFNI